jgi:hypothetical protein
VALGAMNSVVAFRAQGDQVLIRIRSRMAAEFSVVYLKV